MILIAVAIYVFARVLSPPNAQALQAWTWMSHHVFWCIIIVLALDGGGGLRLRRRW